MLDALTPAKGLPMQNQTRGLNLKRLIMKHKILTHTRKKPMKKKSLRKKESRVKARKPAQVWSRLQRL